MRQSPRHTHRQPSDSSRPNNLYDRYDEHPHTDYHHAQLAARHARASSNEIYDSHRQVLHHDPFIINNSNEEVRGRSNEMPPKRQTRTLPPQEDRRTVSNTAASRSSLLPLQVDPHCPEERPLLPAIAPDHPSANGEILHTPSTRIKQNKGRQLLPELSVEAGLGLKKEGLPFPHNDLFEKLRKRDHVCPQRFCLRLS